MKIKISPKASTIYRNRLVGFNTNWFEMLKKIEGKTLEVDTSYLFKDQFSTFPIEGVSDLGLRIELRYVDEIIEDIRPIRNRCNWCGKHNFYKLTECYHCGKSEYLEKTYPFECPNAELFILESNYNMEEEYEKAFLQRQGLLP